ncbi:uncharacterized protein LOC116428023 [Nomia melanderi]|uniref:uncharacterized protein LOC116428023 n=1 Tax=Nomia melanderi TaxID=2448451 RepID=UPI003FCD5C84
MNRSHLRFLALTILTAAASCYGNEVFNGDATVPTSTAKEEEPTLQFMYKIVDRRTSVPCTLANMSLAINVGYITINNETATRELRVPSDAEVSGDCGPTMSKLMFTWGKENQENSVKFILIDDHTHFSVFSVALQLYLDPENFPDAAEQQLSKQKSNNDLGLFYARANDGRHTCLGETKIEIGENLNLTMTNVSLIAFNTMEDYSSRKGLVSKVFEVSFKRLTIFIASDTISYGEWFDGGVAQRGHLLSIVGIDVLLFQIKTVTIPFDDFAHVNGYLFTINDELSGLLKLTWWKYERYYFSISFSIRGTYLSDIYISKVQLYLVLKKQFLIDAKDSFEREVTWRSGLFPMEDIGVLYTCPHRTLRFGDVALTISDILLATELFSSFSRKTVTDCRTQSDIKMEDFNYVVEGEHVPCILANMSISLQIRYAYNRLANLTVPSDAKAEGFCDHFMSKMVLTWTEPEANQQSNSLALYLSRNSTAFSVFFVEANIYFDKGNFPNAIDADKRFQFSSTRDLDIFAGPAENVLFQCMDDFEVNMGKAAVNISNVTLAPFNDQEDMNVKQVYVCPDKSTTTESTITESTTPAVTTPHPSETDYMYVLRYTDRNLACILANMTVSLRIRYDTVSSGRKETILHVPVEGVKIEGNCGNTISNLKLVWWEVSEATQVTRNELKLLFMNDDNYFFLRSVVANIYLDTKNFPDPKDLRFRGFVSNLLLFDTFMGWRQRCDHETVVESNYNGFQVTFNDVALIAFNTYTDVSEKFENTCLPQVWCPSRSLIIGAYVVGSIAAALVVIVLVAGIVNGIYKLKENNYMCGK